MSAAPPREVVYAHFPGHEGRLNHGDDSELGGGAEVIQIAPIVIPTGATQLAAEIVLFALDEDGGLWK